MKYIQCPAEAVPQLLERSLFLATRLVRPEVPILESLEDLSHALQGGL